MSTMNTITQAIDLPRRNRKSKPARVYLAPPSNDGPAPRRPRRPLGSNPVLLEAARRFLTIRRAVDIENSLVDRPDLDPDDATLADLLALLGEAEDRLIDAMHGKPVVVLPEIGKAFVHAAPFRFGDPNMHVGRVGMLDVADRDNDD